jgi:hypothetical protein
VHTLKGFGYLVSTLGVFLLAAMAWGEAKESPALLACLTAGVLASVTGMFFRWLSHDMEHRYKEHQEQF